jgi:Tfp pilus assembly protein PilF
MKLLIRIAMFGQALMLAGCLATSAENQRTRIDEVPMYGGMDRCQVPELKAGDDKFIADVSRHYGSREKASGAWVEQGFKYYQQDNLGMAMRRFNQAWLLNPNNPEVYTGFASVLFDQGKFCEATSMVEKGLSVGRFQDGYLPDAGLVFVGCAMQGAGPDRKISLISRSEELFAQASASSNTPKDYTLKNWARAKYAQQDYRGAWAKVSELRRTTGKDASPEFLRALSAHMPEPK